MWYHPAHCEKSMRKKQSNGIYYLMVSRFDSFRGSPTYSGLQCQMCPRHGLRTKACCELMINDYTRRNFLDGRTARLPTVIPRPERAACAYCAFAYVVAQFWRIAIHTQPAPTLMFGLSVGLGQRRRDSVWCQVGLWRA